MDLDNTSRGRVGCSGAAAGCKPVDQTVPEGSTPSAPTTYDACEHRWQEGYRKPRFILVERCLVCFMVRQRFDPPYVPEWAEPKVRLGST